MPSRAELEALGERMIKAYNDWDIDAILNLRTEDCLHHSFPSSLEKPPLKGRKEYEAFFRPVLPLLRNFTLHPMRPTIVDTDQNLIVMQLKVTAESDGGPYEGEYVSMYYVTDDGTQFKRVDEFADTTLAAKHAGPLIELMKKQAQ